MTVGEKIQLHRKEIGLSQEELGQRLLVSRQTVSLWEMDKTVPTVDNLIRLKEIFGISIDELLTDDADEAERSSEEKEESSGEVDEPLEKYEFTYSIAEMKAIYKVTANTNIQRTCMLFLLLVAWVVFNIKSEAANFLFGVVLTCAIAVLASYIYIHKQTKINSAESAASVYSYEVFDGYFIKKVTRDGFVKTVRRVDFSEIKKCKTVGDFLVMIAEDQLCIFRKSELCEESNIYSVPAFVNIPTAKKHKPGLFMRILSIGLIILSLASPALSLKAMAAVSAASKLIAIDTAWVFYMFAPIPIASIVVGTVMKKRKQKGAANIVVGIIMTVILCAFGSFCFIDTGISYDQKPLLEAEGKIGIDLPEPVNMATRDWTIGEQTVARGYIYYVSDIYFEEKEQNELERQISSGDKWLPSVPSNMVGLFCSLAEPSQYDAILLYNVDTGELNTPPETSGSYRFIALLYNRKQAHVQMVEYTIDYIK